MSRHRRERISRLGAGGTSSAPENQITFTGYSNNHAGWQGYDHPIAPAPATYGALFVARCLGAVGLRRRRPTV